MPKEHIPTEKFRAIAEESAGLGLPQDQIAALIGITDDTLRKYYDYELKIGKARASSQVAKSLYNKAVHKDDTTAMIWWTKAQMRWTETRAVELTGKDGAPIPLILSHDDAEL